MLRAGAGSRAKSGTVRATAAAAKRGVQHARLSRSSKAKTRSRLPQRSIEAPGARAGAEARRDDAAPGKPLQIKLKNIIQLAHVLGLPAKDEEPGCCAAAAFGQAIGWTRDIGSTRQGNKRAARKCLHACYQGTPPLHAPLPPLARTLCASWPLVLHVRLLKSWQRLRPCRLYLAPGALRKTEEGPGWSTELCGTHPGSTLAARQWLGRQHLAAQRGTLTEARLALTPCAAHAPRLT